MWVWDVSCYLVAGEYAGCHVRRSGWLIVEIGSQSILVCTQQGNWTLPSREPGGGGGGGGGGRGQLRFTYSGPVDQNRISRVSFCGYHGSAPYGGSADPLGYIMAWALVSRRDINLMSDVMTCWGCTSSVPCWPRGSQFGRGEVPLGSSFIRLWAGERQLGRKRR